MRVLFLFLLCSLSTQCTKKERPLGHPQNPIKLAFIPSVDARLIQDSSKEIKAYLEKNSPYKFKILIPSSYIVVVEAIGTKKADIIFMNTFGYLLAHEKYGAKAKLIVVRNGLKSYQSEFLVRADSKIKTLQDLNGKKIAFVDPISTSGYILPFYLLKQKNIKPKETVFAMRHGNVVTMIQQKQVDAGAVFYVPKNKNKLQDARRLVLSQYPQVEKEIKILALTPSIPNAPVVFRKDIPPSIEKNVIDLLIKYIKTPEGRSRFEKIYAVTDLEKTTDATYENVRKMIKEMGINIQGTLKRKNNIMSSTLLKITNLSKQYSSGLYALKNIHIEVEKGEFLAIIGLSGSGKSTLLRCCNRLIEPSSGAIYFNGENICDYKGKKTLLLRRDVAMIFQRFNLISRFSVKKNVMMGKLGMRSTFKSLLGIFPKEDREDIMQKLSIVGIQHKAELRADQLSGGQQQRVAIARALAQNPKILLADEPVASLDPATCHTVMDYLKKINEELNITVICSLHFLSLVREYATRVIALKDGEIVFSGSAKEITQSAFKKIYGKDAQEVGIS